MVCLMVSVINGKCLGAENNVGILRKNRFLGQKAEISILTVHTLPTPPPQDVNKKQFQENDLFSGHPQWAFPRK